MLRTPAKAFVVGAGLAALLALSACGGGGGGDAGADDGVASISDPTTADTGDGGDGSSGEPPTEAEMQEAALEFAQCMREHGVDMPDPEFNEGGGVGINVGEAGAIDPETMDAANEACQPIMEDVTAGFEPDPEQEAEMQERALAHAQCMRDNGIENFPDPVFPEGGGAMQEIGPDSGFDPESAEFQEAQEACEEEFGGPAGGGEGGELNTNRDDGDQP